jgi:hypothetical protein
MLKVLNLLVLLPELATSPTPKNGVVHNGLKVSGNTKNILLILKKFKYCYIILYYIRY